MIKKRSVFILLALCCISATLMAQEKNKKYPFRNWIRDSLPPASETLSDLDRMDLIYQHILQVKDQKKGATLLACTGATLRHLYFPFLFGIKIPLFDESKQHFAEHGKNMPANLFADKTNKKDTDKLQHFFASAWLAYIFRDEELADMIGLSVEKYEDLIVKGDAFDERDIRANRLGQQFATLLGKNPNTLPSEVFEKWNAEFLKGENEK